jgi:hypothetical protein
MEDNGWIIFSAGLERLCRKVDPSKHGYSKEDSEKYELYEVLAIRYYEHSWEKANGIFQYMECYEGIEEEDGEVRKVTQEQAVAILLRADPEDKVLPGPIVF